MMDAPVAQPTQSEPGKSTSCDNGFQTWQRKPTLRRARQWKYGETFPGVFKDESKTDMWYVITIHGQKCYIKDGDFIVEEPDGKHHYPCRPDIWLKDNQLCESSA
jgi:hypothetical protein